MVDGAEVNGPGSRDWCEFCVKGPRSRGPRWRGSMLRGAEVEVPVEWTEVKGMMKCGFKAGMSPIRFNVVWIGWAFRANFMYRSVL